MKKIKIEIKTFAGNLLFEYKSESNTIRKTLIKAVSEGADLTGAYLRGADLTGADLRGADLTGAYLTGAYLRGADLTGADLTGADLTGAYLTGADLTGAYLTGADLTGADLRGADLTGIKIKTATIITGLYKYVVIPFISDKGEKWVTMGCYTRTVKEWDKDFWNNKGEFKNDKSKKSLLRVMAYKTAKEWLKIQGK